MGRRDVVVLDRFHRQVLILSLGMFCMSGSYTMLVPFLPLYLMDLGVTSGEIPFWTSIIFSSTFLIGAVMAPVWGRLSDLMGKKSMCLRATICISLSYFLAGLVSDEYELLATRIILGFSNGYMPAAMAMVASMAPKDKLASSLGIFLTGQQLGHICGPFFGGVLAYLFGIRATFICGAALVALDALLVFFFVDKVKGTKERETSSLRDDFSSVFHKPILLEMLFYALLFQGILTMMQSIFSIHVGSLLGTSDRQETSLVTGVILGIGSLAGAATTAFWGRRGQMRGYFATMVITLSVSGFFMALQGFIPSLYLFGFVQFIAGLFLMGTMPSLNAVMASRCSVDFRGRIFGMEAMVTQAGSMMGPLLSGAILAAFGSSWAFACGGAILMAMGCRIYWGHVKRAAPSSFTA